MLIYRYNARVFGPLLSLLGILLPALAFPSIGQGQERRYLFEVSAAGAYESFAEVTGLGGTAGGLARIGVWLPLNLSVEAEGSIASTNNISVKAGSAAVLYNLLLGPTTWGYIKAGIGGTRYGASGDECQQQRFVGKICGTTTTFVTGLGVRVGLSPMLMLRAEGIVHPNRGKTTVPDSDPPRTETVRFSNVGLNVGVSLMLGSKPIPDSDADGILNNRDRCANTPSGAQVNDLGCPADNDADGVANGIDRCPNTAVGAIVDAIGCTRDSDGDNIADGIDKCPDSPAGVLVDAAGCPRDSDSDGIADGLDRCSATTKGATVDALGCPGDEDADGVLDGLDRCPRTAIGATVNSRGCVAGQQGRQPVSAPPADTAATPPPVAPTPRAATPSRPVEPPGAPMVLEGVSFESGSARLQAGSYVELDSIAKVLLSSPNLRVEIGGHTDNAGTPADNQHLSTLRAEAVRNYLVAKGVPFQQMVARGYGSTTPRTPDTTPRGRAANRRVEIRPLPPEP
jgi:outer membrane protein OmpA-like peptidoglycan-associated protein/opacity protein-like surface antigen